jgi:hypothetical protein
VSRFGHIHQQAQAKIFEVVNYYRCPEELIEDRFWLMADKILQSQTPEEAGDLLKSIGSAIDTFCLGLWAKKKIKGPVSQARLQKEAEKAEDLAKFLWNSGKDAKAEQQKQRAESLRVEARAMLAPPPEPTAVHTTPSLIPGACRTMDEVEAQIRAGKKIVILDCT